MVSLRKHFYYSNCTMTSWIALYMLWWVSTSTSAQNPADCIYSDANGGSLLLNLSSLAGVKISGGTSSYNQYEFSPCANEFKCKEKCMINQITNDDGSCACLMEWDEGDSVPSYFASQETWEFQYTNDDYFVRVWWICNQVPSHTYMYVYICTSTHRRRIRTQSALRAWKPTACSGSTWTRIWRAAQAHLSNRSLLNLPRPRAQLAATTWTGAATTDCARPDSASAFRSGRAPTAPRST